MSEPGGVKDFAYRVVGLKVTLTNGAVVDATEVRLGPRPGVLLGDQDDESRNGQEGGRHAPPESDLLSQF